MPKNEQKPEKKGPEPESSMFWADQLADEIINRKDFRYTKGKVPKFKEFVVKTSASLSGVLHIGRLSDTIRGASVHKALQDAGVKTRLIWTAEDMDPLRKVPEGVPKDYVKYLGMPVTDIPDPDGCHKSYADHHKEIYLKVIDQFVDTKMEKFSMREEYRKGSFREQIKKILDNIDVVKEILLKYRDSPLPQGWSPFTPICANCGKVVTPQIQKFEDGKVYYVCKDYEFEKTKAIGCNHKGIADPLKDAGKMMWKSEWASQWQRWNVCAEGAGKEYQVPNSAFWVNAEICERILGYPHPVPIFYEHLMIDGVKMSASLGNVIYPKEWLEVATPELLRMFYNKRLMKTRSFSWKDLPNLYNEYDRMAEIYASEKTEEPDKMKKEEHKRRLFEISHGRIVHKPLKLSFAHAVVVSQISQKDADIIKSLQKTGQWQDEYKQEILERLKKARSWLKSYAPDDVKFEVQLEVSDEIKAKLNEKQKDALKMAAKAARKKQWTDVELHNEFYEICKKLGLDPKEFFRAAYLVLLKKERGPQLANFVLILGERALRLFEGV